ncbi:4-hydroxyphenylpyruvate dioxygenase [Herpetosiphon llansteffanensis]|uniref:4-hydroxyphenylpyruvate dioxygenase n=1 Tax=Herpetosiphon llansteffanensis TaxID=2094568 RepID=UPI000D7C44A5|nr:4-hydroxyphenylpyruvate dioxygenase [Herpetosiphon llansteffanensis]
MTMAEQETTTTTDPLALRGIDYVEMYVGNARQAAHYYRTAFGFTPVAYAGLETGTRDRVSFVMQQRNIRLVLTGALNPDSPIAEHVKLHGDGVKDIALEVENATSAFEAALARGATAVLEPTVLESKWGKVVKATIRTYGDTVHTFVERDGYTGTFMPGYNKVKNPPKSESTGLAAVDHIVGNVELGKMDEWVNFYARILGFSQLQQFTDDDISTEYSALMSKVVQNGTGRIKFPINEPAEGRKKSQIDEYLDYYRGPGAQHIALITPDIIQTVKHLRDNGVEFLRTPDTYYSALAGRVGHIDEDYNTLQELGILVDRDDEGYLLQIFTKPVGDRPTVFYEIIQRKGSRGFGAGNFKALFEAIEREQAKRGNL